MAAERRGSRTMEGGKVLGLELRPPQSRGEGDVNLGAGGYGLLETVVNFLVVLIL